VFVLDRYEGLEPRLLQDFTEAERSAYVEANAAALRELAPADLVFTNHVLLGGPVGAAVGLPFRVKAHGSELEYSMRGRPELERWGQESLANADAVYVGSQHIRDVLEEVCGHVDRVVEVPPGVDVEEFVPQERPVALANLLAQARLDAPNPGNVEERQPDDGNAERLERFLSEDGPLVVYFGKLIEQKGVHLLIDAMQGLDARLLVVGFGPARPDLEAQAASLRALFVGPLEHRHLRHLLPLSDVTVVPSIFPEAFGMVAAEAAAAGSPPLVARHSGLAEVAAGIAEELPERLASLVSFERDDASDLRKKLEALLELPASERQELVAGARRAVAARWSWASVAERLVAPLH
jgi:glycosyltransferase involved in cell wall biosynthesis